MTRSEYYISLPGNIIIGITSTIELDLAEKELYLGAYLPNAKILNRHAIAPHITLHHIESSDRRLTIGKDEIELHDEWRNSFPDDLPHLLYSIARTLWIPRGYYPTHSTCIGKKDDFTLLLGHSGMGKSTITLELVRQFNYKMLSGNNTLIHFTESSGIQAVAGTQIMTLKTKDFEQAEYKTKRSFIYGDRIAFELADDQQSQCPQNIGKIALVRLSDGVKTWSRLSPLSAVHTSYPYILDTIHADCIVAGGNAIYIGDASPDSRIHLANMLTQTLTTIPVNNGVGSVTFLTEKIGGQV